MTGSAAPDRPARIDPAESARRVVASGIGTDPAGAARPLPPSAVNLANTLTLIRLVLIPVFVVVLMHDEGHSSAWRIWAWAVFAVACVTDSIDGALARRRNAITDFGKIADPIADKALIGSALIGLAVLELMSWWVVAVILAREIGVTLLRFWVIRHGVIPASRGGKAKTLTQAVAIGLYILPLSGWLHFVAQIILAAAIVLTLATGVDYVARALRLRRVGRRGRAARAT